MDGYPQEVMKALLAFAMLAAAASPARAEKHPIAVSEANLVGDKLMQAADLSRIRDGVPMYMRGPDGKTIRVDPLAPPIPVTGLKPQAGKPTKNKAVKTAEAQPQLKHAEAAKPADAARVW